MMTDKWIKRWKVPSHSSPDKTYTVAVDREGVYGCSCPAWTRNSERPDCKHIKEVKQGNWDQEPERREPEIVLAHVRAVTAVPDGDDNDVGKCLTPLIPLGHAWSDHFFATLIHDLLCLGVSWRTCQERYSALKGVGKKRLIAYVERYGRCIYGPRREDGGFDGHVVIPCEHPFTWNGKEVE